MYKPTYIPHNKVRTKKIKIFYCYFKKNQLILISHHNAIKKKSYNIEEKNNNLCDNNE